MNDNLLGRGEHEVGQHLTVGDEVFQDGTPLLHLISPFFFLQVDSFDIRLEFFQFIKDATILFFFFIKTAGRIKRGHGGIWCNTK